MLVVERDRLPSRPGPRRGVPQSRQPHVLLHRGLLAMERLLPGLGDDLVAAGAIRYDSGRIAVRSPYGWLPERSSYEVLSATRPLVEQVVRRRVAALPAVTVREDTQVRSLRRVGRSWLLDGPAGLITSADVVVDASGRGTRLPQWLHALGVEVGEPEVVDGALGYASRMYRADRPVPIEAGLGVAGELSSGRSGLALRVEDDHWLILAAGYGADRPSRRTEDFLPYLAGLPDPALVQFAQALTPVSDVAVHRQAGNRRYGYAKVANWPDGLLAVGDSACSFNPILGQGITVAAMQAEVLMDRPFDLDRRPGRDLQARLAALAAFPWSMATGEDRRQSGRIGPSLVGPLAGFVSTRLSEVAVAGDRQVIERFAEVYYLMASPLSLLHPDLALRFARTLLLPVGEPTARPAAVEALADLGVVAA